MVVLGLVSVTLTEDQVMAISRVKSPGSAHAGEVTSEQAEPVVSPAVCQENLQTLQTGVTRPFRIYLLSSR